MEMAQSKTIDDEINRIDRLISIAETMIVNSEKIEEIYERTLSELFSSYKGFSRNSILLSKLHEVGRKKHDKFQCKIPFRDGTYWTECPVQLAHLPFPLGASIGAAVSEVCSICGEEPLDCNHVKGKRYDCVKCIRLEYGYCNICLRRHCVDHFEGQLYDNVQAVGFVKDMKFDHVAMVSNPLEPNARITSIAIDGSLIFENTLGRNQKFKWGDTLYCHHCSTCKG